MHVWLTRCAEPSPHDDSGRRRSMRTGLMAEAFVDRGWEVQWWTSDFDHFGGEIRGHGTQVVPVRPGYSVQYLASQGYSNTRSLRRIRSDAKVARDFARVAREAKRLPDVIIASMPSIDLAYESVQFGAEKNIPVVVDVRDLHPDLFVDMAPSFLRPAVRLATWGMRSRVNRALGGADAIWGNTDGFVAWGCKGAQRTRRANDRTFPIAYEPVELTEAERLEANRGWDEQGYFRPEDINIVFFGSLSQSFDFKQVFDAAKQLETAGTRHRFYFFGRGAYESQVADHCAGSANSHYLGWAVAKDLQTAMARSHIGLAPYLPISNYVENLPNKPTEYMSGGLGVATALDRGRLVDILRETGAGFSYASSDDLARKLSHLADQPDALSAMRDSARCAFAEKFDRQSQSQGMMAALEELVEHHRRQSHAKDA